MAVAGDPPVVVAIQTCELSEHPSVTGVRLRARGRQPLPVAARRQRVHRDHLVAGGDERADEQTAVCLGRNQHLAWLLDVSGHELVEPADAFDALRQPSRRQLLAGVVFDEHVVMRFSPVVADEHRSHRSS